MNKIMKNTILKILNNNTIEYTKQQKLNLVFY